MKDSELLSSYRNGTYLVKLFNNGTKEMIGTEFIADHPDSIDIKITNNCGYGCAFCHESSVPGGKDADKDRLLGMLSELPAGVELAVGGGNPLLYEELPELLKEMSSKWIVNMTVSSQDFEWAGTFERMKEIQKYITSFGVSVSGELSKTFRNFLVSPWSDVIIDKPLIIHVIIGITPINTFLELIDLGHPILCLGYKSFGRASGSVGFYDEWKSVIRKVLYQQQGCGVLSFDNLAIDQLSLKTALTTEDWNRFWTGEEFTHSMYIDAVKEEFAPTSRSPYQERVGWEKAGGLLTYFKNNHA